MATVSKTFSVRNGLDVANTIVLDSNRNISNVVGLNVSTANATTVNATNFITVTGLNVTDQANNARDQANSARGQANTARGTANDAYAQANTARDTANAAYGQANTARGTANDAYSQANAAYADSNTRVLRSGDTMTGNLTVNAFINTNNVFVNKKTDVSPPSTSNTVGERLRLFDFENPGQPNYAIGVEGNHIWTGTDDNTGATGFKWYGNTTQAMLLKSNGDLYLSNTINAKSFVTASGLDVTGQANDAYAQANSARGQANAAYGQANSARDQANTARDTANGAYAQANGAYGQANGAYGQANGAYSQANGAYAQANSAYGQANGAYAQANTAANTVRVYANSAGELSNKFLNFVNTSSIQVTVFDNADGNANIAFTTTGAAVADAYAQANAAYGQANDAYNQANNAYAEANLKLNLTGGTINGSLNVSGNLTITGNTSYINVSTLNVTDPIIFLASNNDTSDVVDIGFIGAKNTGSGVTHTGLVRDAGDGTYYLFDNLADGGHQNNVLDFANSTLAILRANINANSILLTGNAVATQANLTLAHDAANGAYGQANGAYAQANGAYAQANGAYASANGAYAQANGAYAQANGAYAQANVAYGQANDAYAQANAAYADANTRVLKAGDTMTGQLIINTTGTGLTVANANVTSHLTVGTLNVRTNTVTTSTTGQVVLDTFALTAHASAKYFVQANSGTDYTVTEVIVVHDGTNIYLTEYGTIQSGPSLGIFSADIDTGNARLLFTANNNVNTIRSVRYGVLVP